MQQIADSGRIGSRSNSGHVLQSLDVAHAKPAREAKVPVVTACLPKMAGAHAAREWRGGRLGVAAGPAGGERARAARWPDAHAAANERLPGGMGAAAARAQRLAAAALTAGRCAPRGARWHRLASLRAHAGRLRLCGRVVLRLARAGRAPGATLVDGTPRAPTLPAASSHASSRAATPPCRPPPWQAAVLLKNEPPPPPDPPAPPRAAAPPLLPLARAESVAVIGSFAEAPRYQGAGSSRINAYRVDA